MRIWLCASVILWTLNLGVLAAPPDNPVRLRVGTIPPATAKAGDSLTVIVPISVARGFHVNANPASSDDYIPIEVRFDSTGGIRNGAVIYPRGKKWRLEGTTEDLLVYGGDVEVKIPLVIGRDALLGERVIKGSVEFQACDNQVCFLPESLPIALTLHVVKAP